MVGGEVGGEEGGCGDDGLVVGGHHLGVCGGGVGGVVDGVSSVGTNNRIDRLSVGGVASVGGGIGGGEVGGKGRVK